MILRLFGLVFAMGFFLESASAQALGTAEVRFTFPSCPARPIEGYFAPSTRVLLADADGFRFGLAVFVPSEGGVPLRDGGLRKSTVAGAYCTFGDRAETDAREDSVWNKVETIIRSTQPGDRIDISTFSFSNTALGTLLCEALGRGVSLRVVYGSPSSVLKRLSKDDCGADAELVDGAGEGRLQHSKYILVSRAAEERASLSFQSANFSSGLNLHHENWTFVELPIKDRLIVQHACHFEALHQAHFNRRDVGILGFRAFFNTCLDEKMPDSSSRLGIDAYFVPGQREGERSDGTKALEAIQRASQQATQIDLAAHHLTNKTLMAALRKALERGARVRLLLDDEIYWAARLPREGGEEQPIAKTGQRDSEGFSAPDDYPAAALFQRGCERGASFSASEFEAIQELVGQGAELRYVEANHRDFLFFHNKFIVFSEGGEPRFAFTGAGNLSEAGFRRNGENFYFLSELSLVQAFAAGFERNWDTMATPEDKLPITWATEIAGSQNWESWKRAIEKPKKDCRR